jgi:hypothetical protein
MLYILYSTDQSIVISSSSNGRIKIWRSIMWLSRCTCSLWSSLILFLLNDIDLVRWFQYKRSIHLKLCWVFCSFLLFHWRIVKTVTSDLLNLSFSIASIACGTSLFDSWRFSVCISVVCSTTICTINCSTTYMRRLGFLRRFSQVPNILDSPLVCSLYSTLS